MRNFGHASLRSDQPLRTLSQGGSARVNQVAAFA